MCEVVEVKPPLDATPPSLSLSMRKAVQGLALGGGGEGKRESGLVSGQSGEGEMVKRVG